MRITDLPVLPSASYYDKLYIVDTSDTSDFFSGSSKQIDVQNLFIDIIVPTASVAITALTASGEVYATKLKVYGDSVFYGNITAYGSGSIVNISSSTIIIGDNRIQLNAYSTGGFNERYAGLDLTDSGSANNITSSLLWDSLNNYWLLTNNQSGSDPIITSSALILQGPLSTFGQELLLPVNNFLKVETVQGNLTSSNLSEIGNSLSYSGVIIADRITSSFTGSLYGTSSWALYATSIGGSTNAFIQNGNSFGTTAYLGTNDGESLVFETSGSERVRILPNGNVGIGTSNPNAKLHVNSSGSLNSGSVVFRVEGTQGSLFSVDDTLSGSLMSVNDITGLPILEVFSDDKVVMGTFNTNTLVVTGSKVGIGTNNPLFKLDVSGSSRHGYQSSNVHEFTGSINLNGSLFSNANITASNISASGTGSFGILGVGTNIPGAALDVQRMEFPSSGGLLVNFAAGTTTPTTEKYVLLKQTYTGNPYDSPMLAFRSNANSDNSSSFGTIRLSDSGSFIFSNIGSTSGSITNVTEKVRIQSDGYVGIGTATASYLVHLYGGSIGVDRSSVSSTAVIPILSTKMSGSAAAFNDVISVQNSTAINQSNLIIGNTTGQSTFIGSGESATHASNLVGWHGEYLYLGSDEGIVTVTNLQNGPADGFYPFTISPSGSARLQYALTGSSWTQPSNNYTLQISGSNTQGLLYVQSPSASNALYVSGSGYVGIGTTNPGSLLEIYAKPALTSSLLTMLTINTDLTSSSGTGFGGSITFRGRTAGNVLQDNAQISAYNENANDNGYALGFYTRPTVAAGLVQRVTILRGGNVGIGTTNPIYLLDVSGSSRHGYQSSDNHYFTGSLRVSGSAYIDGTISYAGGKVLFDYGTGSVATTGSKYVVLQNLTGSYNAAFFDYFASSGSNFRAGTLIASWSGSSFNYAEYANTDVGDTNQLSMSIDISSSYIRFLSNVSSTINWNIKSSGRYL